jgi:hypothetical protein
MMNLENMKQLLTYLSFIDRSFIGAFYFRKHIQTSHLQKIMSIAYKP